MSEPADIPDADEQMLARLAALDLSAAEIVHQRLTTAESAKDLAELGRTYQRLSRSLRQTLALKAQLKRRREQTAREVASEATPAPRPRDSAPIRHRKHAIREAVLRVVWNEQEQCLDREILEVELDEQMNELIAAGGAQAFLDAAVDDQIQQLCTLLDLPPHLAAGWRDLPNYYETDEDRAEEDAWYEQATHEERVEHLRSKVRSNSS